MLLEHQLNGMNWQWETKFFTIKLWRNDNNRRKFYLRSYLHTPRPHGLLRALTSLITVARSSPSTANCRNLLNLISLRYFYTLSSHLNLCFPFLLLLSRLISTAFLSLLHWSILSTDPSHSNLIFLISAIMSRSLYSSLNSWSVLTLHIPCSTTGPCTLLNISLHGPILFISISVTASASLSNTTAGFTIVVCILISVALLRALDLNICLHYQTSITSAILDFISSLTNFFALSRHLNHVIIGSLSPRHGASSGCEWRKGFRYGR